MGVLQRWVSSSWWLCHLFMRPLCCRPLPVQRLGNINILVMDVVRYQKHHCLSCGLVLAFNLLKFALHLPLSFGIYYLMSSSLSHAQFCGTATASSALLPLPLHGQLCSHCRRGDSVFLLSSFPSLSLEAVSNMTAALFTSKIIYT